MPDDKEDQGDELLALASIYDDDTFTATQEGGDPGGVFLANLNLPSPFFVRVTDQRDATSEITEKAKVDSESGCKKTQVKDLHEVEYLPPITLNFRLPENYPSEVAPEYTLSCKWLSRQQVSGLCHHLDKIWQENVGMVILFSWFTFLLEETFEFLDLQNPLDLSKAVRHNSISKQAHGLDVDKEMRAESQNEPVIDLFAQKNSQDLNDLEPDSRAIQDIASQALLLPAIREHNTSQKARTFNRTLFSCNVCFLEKLGELCIQFYECGHVFCKECMATYFVVQINDGSVKALTCPFDKCESQALPSQVKQLVVSEVFAKYDRLLLQSTLDMMTDIIYCPRTMCQCPVLHEVEEYMGQCPACNFVFCTLCKRAYHGVSPCRINSGEMVKLREAYLEAGQAEKKFLEKRYGARAIKQAMEETYSMEWLDEYSKKCPSCSTHIQKIDGCNKMTCTKCRTYFCWLCKGTLSRTNPYTHFNVADGPCFNRLFEGINPGDEDEGWVDFWE